MTTRDTSDSSSVPSARTVTRYSINVGGIELPVYLAREIDPLLTALADKETENATLKAAMEIDAEDFERAVKVGHWQTDRIRALTARAEAAEADALEERKATGATYKAGYLHGREESKSELEAAEARIVQLNVIVQIAEAKVIDTEVKCGQEIINLRTQLVAAEATLATLREEFQRHKDLSFKLFTDAVDRADKSEATVAHLRERMDAYAQWLWQHNEGADRIVAEKLNEISKEAALPPSAPPQEPTQ